MNFTEAYKNVDRYLRSLEGLTWNVSEDAKLPYPRESHHRFVLKQASDLFGWMAHEVKEGTEAGHAIREAVRHFLATLPPHDPTGHVEVEVYTASGDLEAAYGPGDDVDLLALADRTKPERYQATCQMCFGQVQAVEGRWVHVDAQGA